MERGFVRIIMAVVFSVLIAVSLSSCGDEHVVQYICPLDNGEVDPSLPTAITRDSVDSNGNEANGTSDSPSISADGRYVAFRSGASNLVPNDSNKFTDIFVHDRISGATTRVSVDSSGTEGNGGSYHPSISADGRYIVFFSLASNLVPNDTNGVSDVFVHDRLNGLTTRISVDSSGIEGNHQSHSPSISADGRYVAFRSMASNFVLYGNYNDDVYVHDRQSGATTPVSVWSRGFYPPSISADGRYVAFESWETDLVPNDTNSNLDIFVHDRQNGTTTRISVDSNGKESNDRSNNISISADGRYVAFESWATNLVPNDNNGVPDIFVHDRQSGETTRVSVDSSGIEGNDWSYQPSISADGRYVAFESYADNLIANDTNEQIDIFVHDRQTGGTISVSVDSVGNQSDGYGYPFLFTYPSISADGRYVAFGSLATNLVPNDTNSMSDIFVAPIP